MKRRIKTLPRVLLSGLLINLLLLTSPQTYARAKDETSPPPQSALAVSPAIIEDILDPGKPTDFTVQVNNITNFPLPIKSTVRGFDIQSQELEKTERARLDASQWMTIDEPDFILQPKQVREVKGTIHAPADAAPGGHYATIFFQPQVPAQALSPSTAYLNAKVGVLSFMIIKGEVVQKAGYGNSLRTDGFIARGPAQFTFSIRNSGNVHVMPTGKISIFDWFDKQVATIDLPAGIILPDSTKEYTLEWDAPQLLGKYRAELEANYGDERTPLGKTVVLFWVVPWVEILAGTVLTGLLTLFIIKTRRRWRATWQTLRGKDVNHK